MVSCKTPACFSKTWTFLKKHSDNVLLVILIIFMGIGIMIGLLLRGVDPELNAKQVSTHRLFQFQ